LINCLIVPCLDYVPIVDTIFWALMNLLLTAGSGVQIVADDKLCEEGYHMFPGSQAKLLSVITMTKTPHVFFVSGDVHLAEINAMACRCNNILAY
jgi:hypothetical protein